MRLRWWKAVISDLYSSHPLATNLKKNEREKTEPESLIETINSSNRVLKDSNPTIHALSAAISKYSLTRVFLDRIIDARMVDLECIQPNNFSQVEEYAENTASSLLYLLCEVAGIRDSQVDHAAMHLGKAIGISTLVRGTHHHLANNQLYLPLDIMRSHSLTTGEIMKGNNLDAVKSVVFEIATEAYLHLEQARVMVNPSRSKNNKINEGDVISDGHDHRQILQKYRKPINKIFLTSVRTSMFLEDLQNADFDVFSPALRPSSHIKYQLRLFWCFLHGRF